MTNDNYNNNNINGIDYSYIWYNNLILSSVCNSNYPFYILNLFNPTTDKYGPSLNAKNSGCLQVKIDNVNVWTAVVMCVYDFGKEIGEASDAAVWTSDSVLGF